MALNKKLTLDGLKYYHSKIKTLFSNKLDKTTVATSSSLGLVKSGTDITVDSSGNVSVNDNSHNHTISNISDLTATASELNVLDGITASTAELNYTDGVTSNIQTQLNTKAPLASPTLTGTPKAPTASAGTNTTQIATTAFVQTAVSNGIAASDAMIIKGTIGTSGTVTVLPTTYKTGWTYRVVTDGTYAGQVCEIGDLIVALVDRSGSGNLDSDWCVAQTNINGAITGAKSGDAYITTSQSGSVVTITHKDVSRSNTTSTASPSSGSTFTAVDSVTSDSKGHIIGVNTKTVTIPNNSSTATKLATARTINGTSFDGSENITTASWGTARTFTIKDTTSSHYTTASVDGSGDVTLWIPSTLDCAINGNAATTTKLTTARTIDGVSFNGTSAINHYGTCSTAAATAEKTVSLTGFTLVTGASAKVKFTVTNTASSPTLNINSTGAKSIMYHGSAISAGYLAANRVYEFIYDGTNYELVGDINNTNTTYSAGTGLSLSGTTFNHSNSVTAGTAQGDSSKALTFGGTFTIPTVTYDAQGHITGKGTTTMTMPANPNTDTKVRQTLYSSNYNLPLLMSYQTNTNTTTNIDNVVYRNNSIYANPSTGVLTAPTFSGALSGNATTASALILKGTNTINSTTDDTPTNWASQSSSVHFYKTTGYLTDQPSQYGFVLNLARDADVHQLWMTQANGDLLHRGGNTNNGWSGTWRTILDSSNFNGYALPLSGGTITGNQNAFSVKRNNDNGAFTRFMKTVDGSSVVLGYIGISKDGAKAVRMTPTDASDTSSTAVSNVYTLLDSGNYNTYALPLSGGTMTGNIIVKTSSTGAGFTSMDSNGKVVGHLDPYVMGTESTEGICELTLGNSTAKGTVGNSTGKIYLYGDTGRYVTIQPASNMSSNPTFTLPSSSGTLLTSDNYTDYVNKYETATGSVSNPSTSSNNTITSKSITSSGLYLVYREIYSSASITSATFDDTDSSSQIKERFTISSGGSGSSTSPMYKTEILNVTIDTGFILYVKGYFGGGSSYTLYGNIKIIKLR